MANKAFYSLNHTAITKCKQRRVNTSAAHIRYIARSKTCSHVLAEHMPDTSRKAQNWMKREETEDRKNARMCEKIRIALPKEFNRKQMFNVVREFAQIITKGRAPWFAAFHLDGKDAHNPHVHIVARDRDFETGKRVMFTSAGAKEKRLFKQKKLDIDVIDTARLREEWELIGNKHLEQAGIDLKLDKRSLKAQGIDRKPTIHEGVKSRQMQTRGIKPKGTGHRTINGNGRKPARTLLYTNTDAEKSRTEYNQALKQANMIKNNNDDMRERLITRQTNTEERMRILQAMIENEIGIAYNNPDKVMATIKKISKTMELDAFAKKMLEEKKGMPTMLKLGSMPNGILPKKIEQSKASFLNAMNACTEFAKTKREFEAIGKAITDLEKSKPDNKKKIKNVNDRDENKDKKSLSKDSLDQLEQKNIELEQIEAALIEHNKPKPKNKRKRPIHPLMEATAKDALNIKLPNDKSKNKEKDR